MTTRWRRLRLTRESRCPSWRAEVFQEPDRDGETGRYREARLFSTRDLRYRDPSSCDHRELRSAWIRVSKGEAPTERQATLRADELYREWKAAAKGRKKARREAREFTSLWALCIREMTTRRGRRGRARSVSTMNEIRRVLTLFCQYIDPRPEELAAESAETSLEQGFIPTVPLREIRKWHIKEYLAHREDGTRSEATLRRELGYIRAAFSLATEDELLEANPAMGIKLSPRSFSEEREHRRRRALSEVELDAILEACRTPYTCHVGASLPSPRKRRSHEFEAHPPHYLFAYVLVSVRCACRRGELLGSRVKDAATGAILERDGLCWRDIHWSRHRFYVDGKSGPRAIAMPDDVEDALRRLQAFRAEMDMVTPQVFVGDDGIPVRCARRSFDSAVARARKALCKAGHSTERIDSGIRIHDLRHSAITLLNARGVTPGALRDLAGHSSLQVTNLYLNVDEDRMVDEVRAASRLPADVDRMVDRKPISDHSGDTEVGA